MKLINLTKQKETTQFAKQANEYFKQHSMMYSYGVEHPPAPGDLIALRWNSETVAVLRIADESDAVLAFDTHELEQL